MLPLRILLAHVWSASVNPLAACQLTMQGSTGQGLLFGKVTSRESARVTVINTVTTGIIGTHLRLLLTWFNFYPSMDN